MNTLDPYMSGCEGVRHAGQGVGGHQDHQEQACILPAGTDREASTGAAQHARHGQQVLCR